MSKNVHSFRSFNGNDWIGKIQLSKRKIVEFVCLHWMGSELNRFSVELKMGLKCWTFEKVSKVLNVVHRNGWLTENRLISCCLAAFSKTSLEVPFAHFPKIWFIRFFDWWMIYRAVLRFMNRIAPSLKRVLVDLSSLLNHHHPINENSHSLNCNSINRNFTVERIEPILWCVSHKRNELSKNTFQQQLSLPHTPNGWKLGKFTLIRWQSSSYLEIHNIYGVRCAFKRFKPYGNICAYVDSTDMANVSFAAMTNIWCIFLLFRCDFWHSLIL